MTTLEEVAAFCRTLEGAQQRWPFGPQPNVFAVRETKMFCVIHETFSPPLVTVKCDPIESQLLRAACPAIRAGYHFNKRHWISFPLDGSLPGEEMRRLIHNSHCLVSKRPDLLRPLIAV